MQSSGLHLQRSDKLLISNKWVIQAPFRQEAVVITNGIDGDLICNDQFLMQRTEYLFVFSVPGISATSSFLDMSITGILLITR